jgi:hypothetical protein
VKPSGVPSENHIRTWIRAIGQNHCIVESDASELHALATFVADLFKPRGRLEVKICFFVTS